MTGVFPGVEKIVHGNPFIAGLSGWTQNGSQSFVRSGSYAYYMANDLSNEGVARILQYFAMYGSAVTALFNMHLYVEVGTDTLAVGSARIIAVLVKPDASEVTLYDEEFTAGTDYDDQACSDVDISAYMDQIGTYCLKISSTNNCSWHILIDEPVYQETLVEVSGVSIKVTEKYSKTVVEAIGGGEVITPTSGSGALEGAVLAESLAHEGGYQPGTDPMPTVVLPKKMGLQESLVANVEAGGAEAAGLAETLEQTYGYRQHDLPGMPEGAGLTEYLAAKWQQGNVTMNRDLTEPADIWTDINPVSTDWET